MTRPQSLPKRFICLLLSLALSSSCLAGFPLPAIAAGLVKLSDLSQGTVVKFGPSDWTWIVLAPNTGYLIKQDAYGEARPFDSSGSPWFNPTNPTNIGYYLNNTFLGELSAAEQAMVQNHAWGTGFKDDEDATTASCKVALISHSEYATYTQDGTNYDVLPQLAASWLTRTIYYEDFGVIWYVHDGGSISGMDGALASDSHVVRPTLYLAPNTVVNTDDGNKVIVGAAPAISSVTLDRVSHIVGTAQDVVVNVATSNAPDGAAVAVSLVDTDKNPLDPAVAVTPDGQISGNAASLTLSVPANLAAGSYYVKTTVSGVDAAYYIPYTIIHAAPTVTLDPTASDAYVSQTVTVGVSGATIPGGTNISATLVDSNKAPVTDVGSITGQVSVTGTASLSLFLPPTLQAGDYYVRVSAIGMDSAYAVYTIDRVAPVVTLSSASGEVLANKSVVVTVQTVAVADGTAITAALVDQNKQALGTPITVAGQVLSNGASLILHVPAVTPGVGTYYVEVAVSGTAAKGYAQYSIVDTVVNGTITVAANPPGAGTVTGGGQYAAGADVTVQATPTAGWMFSYWTLGGQIMSYASTYPFHYMQAVDIALVANFSVVYEEPEEPPYVPVIPVVKAPTVATDSAGDVSISGATLYGSIADTGGEDCSAAEFPYRRTGDSSWSRVEAGGGPLSEGAGFSARVTGLRANSTYEFYARASNKAGWGEGGTGTFVVIGIPKVTTEGVSELNLDSARLNATIADFSSSAITVSGFLWGTSPDQLTETVAAAGPDGALTRRLTGLKSNTTYYYKAFATNSVGTGYGSIEEFLTTKVLVITHGVDIQDKTTAKASGSAYITPGSGAVTDCGFFLATTPDMSGSAAVGSGSRPDSNGGFSATFRNLLLGVTYYYQAYASNASGEAYGSILSFTTESTAPTVKTQDASDLTAISATLNGSIAATNGSTIKESGFYWGPNPDPENRVDAPVNSDGKALVSLLDGLKPNTVYYVKAFATNSIGTGYGTVLHFTTPLSKPIIRTTSAFFHVAMGGAALEGNIVSNGGLPVEEYGFRLSGDEKLWVKLVIGNEDDSGHFASGGANDLDHLRASTTYYVQAYARNSLGESYGKSVTFTTPDLPTVRAFLDDTKTGATAAGLAMDITATGGQGLSCTEYRFQFRAHGESLWTTVGAVEGSFGAGTFAFELTRLRPGAKYEFRAQARNCVGWGTSETVTFAATYGATDREGAAAMRSAGFSAVEVANILKNIFRDDDVAAFQAMLYAGFSGTDCARALKDSQYEESAVNVSRVIRVSGLPSQEAAAILRQVFYNGDRTIAIWLVMGGYSIEEAALALKVAFRNPCRQTIAALDGYSEPAVYNAIYKVYGLPELEDYLYTKYRPVGLQLYVSYLRVAGVDAGQVIQKMWDRGFDYRDYNPYAKTMSVKFALPQMLAVAGYSAEEVGSALVQVLGVDPPMVYGALTGQLAGATLFSPADAMNFLTDNLELSLGQMAQVLARWLPDQPSHIMMMLLDRYDPTAEELASALYAAGWTKTGLWERQIGLDMIVYVLANNYDITSPGDVIAVLRQAGVPPLDVAMEMDVQREFLAPRAHVSATVSKWRETWLQAYRQEGYGVADIAAWSRRGSGNYYGTVLLLAQMGYGLDDIVMGMKGGYGWSVAEAMRYIPNAVGYNKLPWTEDNINAAIRTIYGAQDLPLLVRRMRADGWSVQSIARALKETFAVQDPVQAARYLSSGGAWKNDVLTALTGTYFPSPRSDTDDKAALEMLLEVESQVYSKAGLTVFTLECLSSSVGNSLRYVGPDEAIAILSSAGFTPDRIVSLLKAAPVDGYGLDASNALVKLTHGQVLTATAEILDVVGKAYDVDALALAVRLASQEHTGTVLYWTNKMVGNIETAAAYLKAAGYPQMYVLESVANQARSIDTALLVMKNVYGVADGASMLREIKKFFPSYMRIPQFLCEQLVSLYNTDLKAAILLVRDVGGIPVNLGNGSSWVEDVVGSFGTGSKDDDLASILGTANPGDLGLPVWAAVRVLTRMGYGFKETTAWMVENKYPWEEMFKTVANHFYHTDAPVTALRELKGLYDAADLARGDNHYYASPYENYYRVYNDLIAAGYSMRDATAAVLRAGGRSGMASVILAWQYSTVSRTGQGMPAQVVVANLVAVSLGTPGLEIDLTEIGGALLRLGPGTYNQYFSWYELYQGMYAIADLYQRATGVSADTNITALNMLHEAGLDASGAAQIQVADGVGLSAGNILRSLVGWDSPWFEAVENLAQAGYGFQESLEAVWNNEAYHTLIGMSVLSTMVTSAVSILQMAPKISMAIKLYQNLKKVGFIVSDSVKGNYKSAAITGGLLVLSNIPLGGGGK